MRGRDKIRQEIVREYLRGDVSCRELAARYGIGSSTVNRWVRAAGGQISEEEAGKELSEADGSDAVPEETSLVTQVKQLRAELRRAELHNKLLNAMIDIAEEQLH